MSNIKLISDNWKLSMGVTFMIIIYGIISFFIPLFLIKIFPQSSLGNYFMEHIFILMVIYLIISIYFIITGCYYCYLKIDAYVLYITSYRTISGLFKAKNYIEFPHDMLIGFSFFKRPLSLNKTLMLSFKDNSGKKIIKRFNISFLRKVEKNRINKVLEQIIAKNK